MAAEVRLDCFSVIPAAARSPRRMISGRRSCSISFSFTIGSGGSITLANAGELSPIRRQWHNRCDHPKQRLWYGQPERPNRHCECSSPHIRFTDGDDQFRHADHRHRHAVNQVDTLFTAPSNFAGQTVVNNGPQFVSIAANNALGSGSITWSSGILQNPSAGTTTPNLVTLANPINLTGQLTYSARFQADVALTGSLSGFGSLNITGAPLHLSGSNSFNGNIVFNDGTSSLTAQLFAAGQSLPGNQITFSGPGAGELVLTSTGTINSGINASAGGRRSSRREMIRPPSTSAALAARARFFLRISQRRHGQSDRLELGRPTPGRSRSPTAWCALTAPAGSAVRERCCSTADRCIFPAQPRSAGPSSSAITPR